jgi:hypothetical protein
MQRTLQLNLQYVEPTQDALHEIQWVVDISGDIGALPALAISIVLDAWSPPMVLTASATL